MAKQEATLLLKIKQAGQEVLNRLVFTFGDLVNIAKTVTNAMMSTIDAYAESEKAINELTQSMVNQGVYSTQLKNTYLRMADALEEVTGVNDDQIIKSQALLQAHLGQTEITESLMRATINLAAAKKMDLSAAAELVGRTINSENNALKRNGIEFDNATRGAERYEAVIGAIEGKYAGFAEQQGKGVNATIHFKNAVDDLLKSLGSSLAPAFEQATIWATKFIKAITPEADNFDKLNSKLNQTRARVAELMRMDPNQVKDDLRIAQQSLEALLAQKKSFLDKEKALEDESRNAKKQKQAEDRALELEDQIKRSEEDLVFRQGQYAIELADEENKNRAQLDAQMRVLDAKIKNEDDASKKLALMKQKAGIAEQIFEDEKNKKLIQSRANFLNHIASLQSSSNQTLATIGKAAAMMQAWISTYQAANDGLAWGTKLGGPALGMAFQGLAYAAGAANVAKIAGLQLAEGGIVMPRPGGTQATIGEAGQAEAVIPLDRAGEFGLGGGGGNTYVFNGPVLGDRSQARQFAEWIDEGLYDLRKSNRSKSFDSGLI